MMRRIVQSTVVHIGRIIEDEDVGAESFVTTSRENAPRSRSVVSSVGESTANTRLMTMSSAFELRTRVSTVSKVMRMSAHVSENIKTKFRVGVIADRFRAVSTTSRFTKVSTIQVSIGTPRSQGVNRARSGTISDGSVRGGNIGHINTNSITVRNGSSHQGGSEDGVEVVTKIQVHGLGFKKMVSSVSIEVEVLAGDVSLGVGRSENDGGSSWARNEEGTSLNVEIPAVIEVARTTNEGVLHDGRDGLRLVVIIPEVHDTTFLE